MNKPRKTTKTVKKKKPKKRALNERQTEALKIILENRGKISASKAMKTAGYSDAYAKNPQQFKATEGGKSLAEICDALRDKALKEAEKKLGEARFSELTHGAETLHKMSRVETGLDSGDKEIIIRIETFKGK